MNNEVLLTAKALREKKYYRPYNSFRPNFKNRPITGKFYSIHEMFGSQDMNLEYRDLLASMYSRSPQSKYGLPVTESHRYGWYRDPLIDNNKDFRIDFRSGIDPEIKLAIEMQRMVAHMRK